jgi:Multiubiquitin
MAHATDDTGEAGKHDPQHDHPIIFIDRKEYKAPLSSMTGAQLRVLADPDIGPDRDLWQEVPGGEDRIVENDESLELRNGEHFYSAPSTINPG